MRLRWSQTSLPDVVSPVELGIWGTPTSPSRPPDVALVLTIDVAQPAGVSQREKELDKRVHEPERLLRLQQGSLEAERTAARTKQLEAEEAVVRQMRQAAY